jgi:hypothetical protein
MELKLQAVKNKISIIFTANVLKTNNSLQMGFHSPIGTMKPSTVFPVAAVSPEWGHCRLAVETLFACVV